MKRYIGIALAALLCSGCKDPTDDCSPGDSVRCRGNAFQVCSRSMFDDDRLWLTVQQCTSPQVCGVDTAGPTADLAGENGCFAPNAYCPSEGDGQCNMALSEHGHLSGLYECTLRVSDQTLHWSTTNCGQLVPGSMCATNTSDVTACFEIVENCPGPPALYSHCEASDLLQCVLTITDKAVFDWIRTSCSAVGRSRPSRWCTTRHPV